MTKRSIPDGPCPCGSKRLNSACFYSACCGPVHDGKNADDAAQLMRSRYSAYALGLSQYLLDTWHPQTRPQQLDLSDSPRWLGLKVLRHESAADTAIVEFVARHSSATGAQRMHEISRFRFENGRWFYLDGTPGATQALKG